MKKLKIEKNRYLVAVSGGPDSMALLDMCRNTDSYIEVAHVNYHKRDSADHDEKLLRKYCRRYRIVFHRLNVYKDDVKGNFQSYARDVRYDYFFKLCKKHSLLGVIVGHHQDDLVETYLMQKEKKLGVSYYGLNSYTIIKGVKVFRPLLDFRKKDLIDYCHIHNIEYGIDESNLKDEYTRNRIRHQYVEKMSDNDRKKILKEINDKNKLKKKQYEKIIPYLNIDSFTYEEFLNIPELIVYLRTLFPHKADRHYQEMIRQISNTDSYQYHENGLYLTLEYGIVNIFNKPLDYCYSFDSFDELKNKKYDYFKIVKRADSFHCVTLKDKDFPITIRNYQSGDFIMMKYGKKKLNRFFIDHKIPLRQRMSYPVVFNRQGSVILVPKLGCDSQHYSHKPNLYMIEL